MSCTNRASRNRARSSNIKALVASAAGKTGRCVVEQASAAGYQVAAFVRNADEFQPLDVRVAEGDATHRMQK